mgnify:CR=1 FL=1
MRKEGDVLKLTMVELIALKACLADSERARRQLAEVQAEIGLAPGKNYNITDDGVVTEIKQVEVKT